MLLTLIENVLEQGSIYVGGPEHVPGLWTIFTIYISVISFIVLSVFKLISKLWH